MRDLQLFELWVQGYTQEEILEHPDNPGYETKAAVERRLRLCVEKLREFAGVDPTIPIRVGRFTSQQTRTRIGVSQKEYQKKYYSDPEKAQQHRERDAERKRRKRAAAKKEQGLTCECGSC